MHKTIEEIVGQLRHAIAMHESAKDDVKRHEEARDEGRAQALKAEAELVAAYPERDQWEDNVRELREQLIAAEGEPS